MKLSKKSPIEYLISNYSIIFFSCIITIYNFYWTYRNLWHRRFNVDEFQHTHIAWNLLQGQIQYKDFYDIHGSLYAFFSSLILNLIEKPESVETLFILRNASFIFSLFILILIYLISKHLFKSNYIGFIAIALFSISPVTQNLIFEVRPDIIQNCFVLLGIYFLFVSSENQSVKTTYLAGLSLGIAGGFNAKSLFVVVVIIINQIIEALIQKNLKPLKKTLPILAGVATIYCILSIYFFKHNAISEFYYYNFLHGLLVLSKLTNSESAVQDFFRVFLQTGLALTILSFFSILKINFKNSKERLLVLISIFMVIGSLKGFYLHYSTIYLPFWSILASYCIVSIMQLGYSKNNHILNIKSLLIFITVITILILSPLNVFRAQSLTKNKRLILEINEINWVLSHMKRTDLVRNTGIDCPAYVFNQTYGYYWLHNYIPLGNEPEKIKLIAASKESMQKKKNNPKLREYQLENFRNLHIDNTQTCIWVRKKS